LLIVHLKSDEASCKDESAISESRPPAVKLRIVDCSVQAGPVTLTSEDGAVSGPGVKRIPVCKRTGVMQEPCEAQSVIGHVVAWTGYLSA
jgi:hypothetical protein